MTITFDLDPAAASRLRRSLGLGPERSQRLYVLDTPDLIHRSSPLIAAEDPGAGPLTAVIAMTISLAERPDGVVLERSSLIAGGHTAERLTLSARRPFAAALRGRIADAEPVPVGPADDVATGYRLLTGEPWQPVKGGSIAADADMPLNRYVAGLLRSCHAHLLAQLRPLVREGRVEAIHQARVALRRLRAGLAAVGHLVGGAEADALRGKARTLAGLMGRTRDWDVFLAETLPEAQAAYTGESGWPGLRDYGTLQRRAEWTLLARAVGGPAMLDLLLAILDWADQLSAGLDDPRRTGEVLPDLLEKRWRRIVKMGEGFDSLPVEQRHELRIEVKKLRYLFDFSKNLFRAKDAARWEDAFAEVQAGLGALNDGATARVLLHGALEGLNREGAYSAGLLVGWLEARAMAMQPGLGRHWRQMMDLTPPWR